MEENRNQVAIRRGRVVYCLESPKIPAGKSIFGFTLSAFAQLNARKDRKGESTVISLTGEAIVSVDEKWNGRLYREVNNDMIKKILLS